MQLFNWHRLVSLCTADILQVQSLLTGRWVHALSHRGHWARLRDVGYGVGRLLMTRLIAFGLADQRFNAEATLAVEELVDGIVTIGGFNFSHNYRFQPKVDRPMLRFVAGQSLAQYFSTLGGLFLRK